MAEYRAGDDGQGQDTPPRPSGLINILGGLMSLALLVGIGYWGYGVVMRDVSGVPVVRALEGPVRVQPDNPGGVIAAHQGLSVNTVPAAGAPDQPADRLLLAPAPVEIGAEDVVQVRADADALMPDAAEAADPDAAPEATAEAADPAVTFEEDPEAAIIALANELAAKSFPLTELAPGDTAAEEPAAAAEPAPPAFTGPGLARSLRPQTRPETLTRASLTLADPAETPGGVRDVDPASIAVGTRLVQLGAFPSAEVARDEWGKLAGRFDEYLDGKDRVIQRASSGGRTFYRLRAMGFADLSDARRFCSALVAEGADCIPVVVR